MNEQGYEQTPEQAEDRKRTEAEEAEYEGIDEDIEQIIKAAGQLPEADRSIEAVPASELNSTVMVSPPPESVAWEERNESTT